MANYHTLGDYNNGPAYNGGQYGGNNIQPEMDPETQQAAGMF